MSIYNLLCGIRGVVSGSQTYDTPGTYTLNMTVIPYNTITIQVYGGGGGGAVYNYGAYGNGQPGGTSIVYTNLGEIGATGGQQGLVYSVASNGGYGYGPSGVYTLNGGGSAQSTAPVGGAGAGPLGGAGGYWYTRPNGLQAGGGGAAFATESKGGNYRSVSGGGGGGYASYTTALYIGDIITIVVANGGAADGGVSSAYGASGRVILTWS